MIIYPPIVPDELVPIAITGTKQIEVNGTTQTVIGEITMKIPFINNPAVNINNVVGLGIELKDFHTSTVVERTFRSLSDTALENGYRNVTTDGINGSKENIVKNNAYKIQISYLDETSWNNRNSSSTYSNLAWSTAITGFCFGKPPSIEFYNTNILSMVLKTRITNLSDSEPLYQYRFRLYKGNSLIEESGWQYTTSASGATANEYSYQLQTVMDYTATNYKAIFYYKTVSGYEGNIQTTFSAETPAGGNSIDIVNAVQNIETGGIEITLKNASDSSTEKKFVLQKKTGSKPWLPLQTFILGKQAITTFVDYALEQGTTVKYRTQHYNPDTNKYNSPISTKVITISNIDFEHLFLNDGDKQLTIAFNPKVSGFKYTILEAKVDTIGGKYPYFSRNGQIEYAEIPISGLISYHMDNDELFVTKNSLGIENKESFNMSGLNISAERKFRKAVYDWLNNGQYKVLRSPTEGNFIVRLMNVSLTPNDQLSRMLYNFSATAYEVAEYNQQNLKDNDLILGG